MSHSKIRTEKICLNCGTPVPARYCPVCGQENIEPRQTVWHLVTHFFSDITHFDGKFFLTVKDLFLKPGLLSREYMAGRRAAYLDPIRMYVFTSAFFFIVFFWMINVNKLRIAVAPAKNGLSLNTDQLLAGAKTAADSAEIRKAFEPAVSQKSRKDSPVKKNVNILGLPEEYESVRQYDSAQRLLPSAKRDSWLKSSFRRKGLELYERNPQDRAQVIREWVAGFIHNFPKMLFLSLPLFALLLKLLYVRRKQFYYVDHGIFSIHLYIFTFLFLLLYFGIRKLDSFTGWKWLDYAQVIILIFPLWYFYKAMRNFYGQNRWKTLLKHFLLFWSSFLVQIILFLLFLLLSILDF